jgi:peptide/nickel transport system permease protein
MLILEFLVKRIAQGLLIVFITSLIIFTLLRVVPGDPVRLIVGGMAPPDVVEQVATKMGLRDPIIVQYGRYMRVCSRATSDNPICGRVAA